MGYRDWNWHVTTVRAGIPPMESALSGGGPCAIWLSAGYPQVVRRLKAVIHRLMLSYPQVIHRLRAMDVDVDSALILRPSARLGVGRGNASLK